MGQKLKQKFQQLYARKNNILFFIFLGLFLYFLGTEFSFAANDATGTASGVDENLDKMKNTVVAVVNFFASATAVVLALMTYLISLFLSPEWINGNIFGIGSHLKAIWILVSNVVYVIFAFILIGIAFANIVGISNDKVQLKQSLPKFFVGVLIVPFTWFIVQFILSLSSILTIAALNLPFDTFPDYKGKVGAIEIPTKCVMNIHSEKPTNVSNNTDYDVYNSWFRCKKDSKETISNIMGGDHSSDTIFGVISVYTFNILGIEGIDKIEKEHIKDMLDIIIKIVFDMLFIIVYFILMVGLGMVLITRGIWLWIYTMLSPLFGLMYFFGKSSGGSGFFEKFNVKEFLALAMVPVYATLALSFGMLFIYITGTGIVKQSSPDNPVSIVTEDGKDTLKMGKKISLTLEGSSLRTEGVNKFISDKGETVLGGIGSLIMKIFGVVVLWGTMMAAMKASKITEAVIMPLADFGTKVGEIAQAAPTYAPIPFTGQSMQSINRVGQDIQSVFDQDALNRKNKFVGDNAWFFKSADWIQELQQAELDVQKASAKEFGNILNRIIRSANGDRTRMLEGINRLMLGAQKNTELRKIGAVANWTPQTSLENAAKLLNPLLKDPRVGNIFGMDGDTNLTAQKMENYSRQGTKDSGNDNNSGSNSGTNSSSGFTSGADGKDIFKFQNLNINVTRDSQGKYSILESELGNVANSFNQNPTEAKSYTDKFTQGTLKGLKAYFDSNGKFVSGGGQTNGKFPWEVTENN